ncbi:NADH dehydrogenase subunit D [Campylobacter hyointestinalis subsp. hyointestinalis]|uniref:NADH-quinone oxidoreductase subunit D n=1 Tax=Campylobacter hyointestinalis TaxID=198 RepID=UPI000CE337E5|nr:NADH-quinone oxidoreductase subunit D [Campylobacter hyointestinalis]PPB68642.1 NADH dehydrogenase subunit D [Campylobacter hyointestinalis subsp. hyointestinalis]
MFDEFSSKFKVLETCNDNSLLSIKIDKEDLLSAVKFIKETLKFEILLDIVGVDNLNLNKTKRFSVYYIFRRLDAKKLCIWVDTDDSIQSVQSIYKSANWAERECFDQFGVIFNGHPNLKRILNHKEFVGHPLRKDYPIDAYQVLHTSDDLVDEMKLELKRNNLTNEENDEFKTKYTFLNIGPSHPATHGTIRNFVALDGEKIVSCVTEIGYLHRGFEKSCEHHTYAGIIPYTDRLNYCSALLNNVGYAKAVEEILGVEITNRTKFMRVILGELARIIDHEVCLAAMFVDMGGLTNYWYLYNPREKIYNFLSKLTGARFTNSFARIGGMANDFYEGWKDELKAHLIDVEKGLDDTLTLIEKNRIFLDRTQGICKISKADALSYGFSGPNLRASGVAYDLRKDKPYYFYDSFDFSVPVGSYGDIYDRMFVRFFEMKESISIIRQAINLIPNGDINIKDKDIVLPPKDQVYGSIEGLINHFKLVFDGIKLPSGHYYSASEGANGELGFFILSSGETKPYRLKLRPPCFYALNAFSKMVEGSLIADSILNLGSLNIIAGELDR